MVRKTEIDESRITVELCYESASIIHAVCDYTHVSADAMKDKDGNDLFTEKSVTEDDAWILHRFINKAWNKVTGFCRAYMKDVQIVDEDEVTPLYELRISMPGNWQTMNAAVVDGAIRDYLTSFCLTAWWLAKGDDAMASMESVRVDNAENSIRFWLNAREHGRSRRPYAGL